MPSNDQYMEQMIGGEAVANCVYNGPLNIDLNSGDKGKNKFGKKSGNRFEYVELITFKS